LSTEFWNFTSPERGRGEGGGERERGGGRRGERGGKRREGRGEREERGDEWRKGRGERGGEQSEGKGVERGRCEECCLLGNASDSTRYRGC